MVAVLAAVVADDAFALATLCGAADAFALATVRGTDVELDGLRASENNMFSVYKLFFMKWLSSRTSCSSTTWILIELHEFSASNFPLL